jgi:hypothetical protein
VSQGVVDNGSEVTIRQLGVQGSLQLGHAPTVVV